MRNPQQAAIRLALLAMLEADYWEQRKKEARKAGKSDVLKRLAGNETPREGDELPQQKTVKRTSSNRKTLTVGGR